MITQWLEEQAVHWLTNRGWLVLRTNVPSLVITYGIATRQKLDDGSTLYTVAMPEGHKLWALLNTIVTTTKEI